VNEGREREGGHGCVNVLYFNSVALGLPGAEV